MKPPCMVKILGRGHGPHGNVGMLLAIKGQHAIVKPRGHARAERVPLSMLREWRSRNQATPR